MTWKIAYKRQAKSDFSIFLEFRDSKPKCHSLHYLQMATEKLAKSFLCENNNSQPITTHYAFVKFLRVIKTRPDIRSILGYSSHSLFSSFINSLLPEAEKIENLAPVGDNLNKPNPEYPWIEVSSGHVICPEDHDFNNISYKTPQIMKLIKLVEILLVKQM